MSCMDTLIDKISEIGEKVVCKTMNMITNGVKVTLRQTQMVFKRLIEAVRDAIENDRIKKERIKEETRREMEQVLTLYKLNMDRVKERHKTFEFSEYISSEELEFELEEIRQEIAEDCKLELDVFFECDLVEKIQDVQDINVFRLSEKEMPAFRRKLSEISDLLKRAEEEGRAIVHALRGEEYDPDMVDERLTAEDVAAATKQLISLVREIEANQQCVHSFSMEMPMRIDVEEDVVVNTRMREEVGSTISEKQKEIVKK